MNSDQTINSAYLEQFEDFQDFKSRSRTEDDTQARQDSRNEEDTPDETLLAAHKKLEAALAASLLDQVRQSTPLFFEEMIVQLFLAMGYGGTSQEAGRALGRSGDNGIDGVIDQDPLGVDQIYLQAKRYGPDNTVGSGDIRDFFGALNIHKATKGIFVTTSQFTPSARRTVKDLGSRIVLIDGVQLAHLMIKYNVGCRDKDVLHIKEIDEAFFEDLSE